MAEQIGTTPLCTCADHGVTGVDDLVDLINADVDQRTASLMLWAPEQLPLAQQLVLARQRATEIVREGLADVLAWLEAAGVPA